MKAVSGSWHKKWPKAIRPRVSSKAGWSGLKLLLIALPSADLRDRSLRHSASAIPKTRLCSLGPDGVHSSIKAACNASNSRGSSPGRMRGSAKTPCFCAFGRLRLGRGTTELFSRPLCLNTGGIEWSCLRMAAPPKAAPPGSILAKRVIRFRKNTLARLEFLHQESAKKKFRELLCRDPRCAQGVLYEDIHYAQGSLIRR